MTATTPPSASVVASWRRWLATHARDYDRAFWDHLSALVAQHDTPAQLDDTPPTGPQAASGDLDLTEPVEAAAAAYFAEARRKSTLPKQEWHHLTDIEKHRVRAHVLPAVAAAAPIIATQVRDRIALEAQTDEH